MADLADVEDVAQQIGESPDPVSCASGNPSIRHRSHLRPDALGLKVLGQLANRTQLNVAGEEVSDDLRLILADEELPVAKIIAHGDGAAHPHALLLRGGDLVPDALAGHFPLELGQIYGTWSRPQNAMPASALNSDGARLGRGRRAGGKEDRIVFTGCLACRVMVTRYRGGYGDGGRNPLTWIRTTRWEPVTMAIEKFEYFNEESDAGGFMSATFDVQTGEVQALGTGFYSVRQATAYFADWCATVRRIHAAGRSVFALLDLSDNPVQKAEVAEIIATATVKIYREGDAIAVLVPTNLAKMQARRVLDAAYHDFFLSRSAAEAWLNGRRLTGGRSGTANR